MRILVDYRAALRSRTGVGAYIHEMIRAYTAAHADDVTLFSSSWKDRLDPAAVRDLRASLIDSRVPVRLLNLLWHRLEWPPVETWAGPVDVVHSAHPLLLPSRHAAQVVTIHDLFFLSNPERTRAEIRRDYPALVTGHARRADAIITSTEHGRALIAGQLGVAPERIYVCSPGAPAWRTLGRAPNLPADGTILFVGTLEARKNVGALLGAYERLIARLPSAPPLVLAGRATADAAPWLARLATPPLAGRVRHLGYVRQDEQEQLYGRARLLVLPSFDEGFGLPVLEAMSAGVPVIASRRGALPEVVGDAGVLVEPDQEEDISRAMERLLTDQTLALSQAEAGLQRARAFSWATSAATLRGAYLDSIDRRRRRAAGH